MRPMPHTLVLSLVGATPIAKVQQLFSAAHTVSSAADATLPLLLEAQAQARAMASDQVCAELSNSIGAHRTTITSHAPVVPR